MGGITMRKKSNRYKTRLDMRKVLVVYYTRKNDNLKRELLIDDSFRKFSVAHIRHKHSTHNTPLIRKGKVYKKSKCKHVHIVTRTFDKVLYSYKQEQRLNSLTRLNPSTNTDMIDDSIMYRKELSNLDRILTCTDKKVIQKRMRLLCKKLYIRMKDIPNKSTIKKYRSNIYYRLLYSLYLAVELGMRPCDTEFLLMMSLDDSPSVYYCGLIDFDGDVLNLIDTKRS